MYGRLCRYLTDAIAWASHVQKELLQLDWPPELLAMEGCQELRGEQGQRLWRGLRIRMGMAYGYINVKKPMNTGTESRACTAWAHGSGILSRANNVNVSRFAVPTWYAGGVLPSGFCCTPAGRADYFGELANTAARVAALAAPGQILIESSQVGSRPYSELPPTPHASLWSRVTLYGQASH